MRENATRTRDIARIGRIRTEGIDLDQPRTDAGDLAEPAIADDQCIRTGPQQEIHRHQAVSQTMRMIRDHDERSRTRDTREALVAPGIAQPRLLHRGREEIRPSRHMNPFKEGIEVADLKEAIQHGFGPGQRTKISPKFVGVAGGTLR